MKCESEDKCASIRTSMGEKFLAIVRKSNLKLKLRCKIGTNKIGGLCCGFVDIRVERAT